MQKKLVFVNLLELWKFQNFTGEGSFVGLRHFSCNVNTKLNFWYWSSPHYCGDNMTWSVIYLPLLPLWSPEPPSWTLTTASWATLFHLVFLPGLQTSQTAPVSFAFLYKDMCPSLSSFRSLLKYPLIRETVPNQPILKHPTPTTIQPSLFFLLLSLTSEHLALSDVYTCVYLFIG